jgi:NitT/TauT family transport system substrate-binding protein
MRTLLYIIVICCTVGCSKDNNANKNANANKIQKTDAPVKVAVLPVEECLPLYVAEHLGLLDSLHANVTLCKYGALSECHSAIFQHKAEVTINDSALRYYFLTSQKARIHRIAQLSDKVIAADSKGYSYNMARTAIDSLLNKRRHVFIIQVEDINIRTKMLISGNVDAALLPEPYASRALEAGAYKITLSKNNMQNDTLARSLLTKHIPRLERYLVIARDSLKVYGKDNYLYLLK